MTHLPSSISGAAARAAKLETLARNLAAWLESEGSTDDAAYIRRRLDEIDAAPTIRARPCGAAG